MVAIPRRGSGRGRGDQQVGANLEGLQADGDVAENGGVGDSSTGLVYSNGVGREKLGGTVENLSRKD